MTEMEHQHNRWKGRINRMDGTNIRKNTTPKIPAININIIIYQRKDALADESIESKGAFPEIKKHIRMTGQIN